MKIRKLIACVLFIFFALLPAQELKKTRFYTEFDLYTGLKAGICHCFTERIALYSSMGIALASPTQVSYNIFAAYSLLDTQRKFGLDLNAGLIHGVFDIIGPALFPEDPYYDYYFFANPGLALHASCKLGQKLRMGLRLGSEIMIGYEQDEGTWKIHPRLEPNAALTLLF
ncbi:MAG: hypothetical protein PHX07_01685 [Candidatus Marinimicrobia bacterium]|nr:hypothetical protein [Candidatus Neomarinimicrobiota bacterium]MDD4960926.1 hypothetical protein [Candidatus Neomarinimicrobiota bacterium]MDD5710157.1 hypothetical protein [Candidatus Neomarinimicrobiota bacterium]